MFFYEIQHRFSFLSQNSFSWNFAFFRESFRSLETLPIIKLYSCKLKPRMWMYFTHLWPLSKSKVSVCFMHPMSGRYSTNWDRKGWAGSEIQMYYGCPCFVIVNNLLFKEIMPDPQLHPWILYLDDIVVLRETMR